MNPIIYQTYRVPQRIDSDGRVWRKGITDMNFTRRDVGWAVGASQILRTVDGGRNWKNVFADFMTEAYFSPHRVCAPTEDHCWVIDTIRLGPYQGFRTTNRGETWQVVKIDGSSYLQDVFFLTNKNGWILGHGGDAGKEKVIHITDDGGRNWRSEELTIEGKPEFVRFVDPNNGWLIERRITTDRKRSLAYLHRTENGGLSWVPTKTFQKRILDIALGTGSELSVCGEEGLIAVTFDAGKSWSRSKLKCESAINTIDLAVDRAIAGGDFGVILVSDNKGLTWNKLDGFPNTANCVRAEITSNGRIIVAFDNAIYLLLPENNPNGANLS